MSSLIWHGMFGTILIKPCHLDLMRIRADHSKEISDQESWNFHVVGVPAILRYY